MNFPSELKYTQNDEWIKVEGNTGTVGITDFAQDQLSDIVFVEVLPSIGDKLQKGETTATVESVKAAAEVYVPVSGTVIAINEALPDNPEKINQDPYGEAWMLKIELANPAELEKLMDAEAYQKHVDGKK